MNKRLEEFLEMCVALTGFSRQHLLGTGMPEAYLEELEAIVGSGFMDELLSAFSALPDSEAKEDAISRQILEDSRLGPVVRNIIVMWYSGTWKQLPPQWRVAHGVSARDEEHVVSAAAYLSGLQWTVVGSHPPGGMPPGFATWAAPAK